MTITLDGTTGITTPSDNISGNLAFTGTGNRITGEFNNATVASRVMFQSSTVNGTTRIEAIPNGTGTTANLGVYNNSDPTNAAVARLTATSTETRFESTITGTGTYLPMTFYTNGSERARIDTGCNSIFGKTTTAIGTVGAVLSPSGNITLSNAASTSAADGIDIYSTGAAAYRFYVQMSGQINATSTSIVAISDISLKENIRDLETGLTQILALQPRRFDWKEETQLDEKNVAGFIAQEVEQVLPELVYDYKYSDTETKKSVKMGDILPTLVKAIQEQQALITSLTDRIAALEAR